MDFSLKRYWKLRGKAQQLGPKARYDDEVLCASWNPELSSLLQSNGHSDEQPNPQPPFNAGKSDL